jgi:hypothetical protein
MIIEREAVAVGIRQLGPEFGSPPKMPKDRPVLKWDFERVEVTWGILGPLLRGDRPAEPAYVQLKSAHRNATLVWDGVREMPARWFYLPEGLGEEPLAKFAIILLTQWQIREEELIIEEFETTGTNPRRLVHAPVFDDRHARDTAAQVEVTLREVAGPEVDAMPTWGDSMPATCSQAEVGALPAASNQ